MRSELLRITRVGKIACLQLQKIKNQITKKFFSKNKLSRRHSKPNSSNLNRNLRLRSIRVVFHRQDQRFYRGHSTMCALRNSLVKQATLGDCMPRVHTTASTLPLLTQKSGRLLAGQSLE